MNLSDEIFNIEPPKYCSTSFNIGFKVARDRAVKIAEKHEYGTVSMDVKDYTNDYNDGNWHGWRGGECPVHPRSMVETLEDRLIKLTDAGFIDWSTFKGAFRVVEVYTGEPKEFWFVADRVFEDYDRALNWAKSKDVSKYSICRLKEKT